MRNRQQPPSVVSGEILSTSVPDPFQTRSVQTVEQRVSHLPTVEDFSGVLNIGPRLKAWGQKRGMESLALAIDACTVAVNSRRRLAQAIIELEAVEATLGEIDKIRTAAVIDVEMRLRAKEAELEEQRHGNEMRVLTRELEKEELSIKLLNVRFRRQREEAKLTGTVAPEKSIDEQITELSAALIATQREMLEGEASGRLTEAEIHVMETKISVILRKLDKLRQQEEPT